jgi:hypothetical protein
MKLKGVRLDEAEQTTAGRTKVLRTDCADNAEVRLVSAGWVGRQICEASETALELSVNVTQKSSRSNWKDGRRRPVVAAVENIQFPLFQGLYVSNPTLHAWMVAPVARPL